MSDVFAGKKKSESEDDEDDDEEDKSFEIGEQDTEEDSDDEDESDDDDDDDDGGPWVYVHHSLNNNRSSHMMNPQEVSTVELHFRLEQDQHYACIKPRIGCPCCSAAVPCGISEIFFCDFDWLIIPRLM